MHTKLDIESPRDREISRRFAQMRQQDAAQVPNIPNAEVLAKRIPLETKNRFNNAVPKVAAAIAVAIVTGILMMSPSQQDPGVLYADIMGGNTITTDHLMMASPITSPELVRSIGAYDIDVSIGPAQKVN